MVAQGALAALVKIAAQADDDEKTKLAAAHGVARILVTTDPRLIKDSHAMDAMGPLIFAVRKDDHDLITFEALLALTNLASLSIGAKERIVELKGIRAFEYAQFSDNQMVRRAATEALCNLAHTDGLAEWLQKPEKLKFWMLLCKDADGDAQTASAALGALANLCFLPAFAGAMLEHEDAVDVLVFHWSNPNAGIAHRAIVAMMGLFDACSRATFAPNRRSPRMRCASFSRACRNPTRRCAGHAAPRYPQSVNYFCVHLFSLVKK